MRKSTLAILLLSCAATARAAVFTVDQSHAEVGFSVKHLMVSKVKGTFNSFEGTLDYDPKTKELSTIEGSISTASIDTNNSKRDDHLKSAEFFNIGQYPKMEFKSTSIEKKSDGSYEVAGMLNVLGVDHPVVLPVTINGPVEDPWGNQRIGIESTAQLNRRSLGISSSPATMIGDEVNISINAEAISK